MRWVAGLFYADLSEEFIGVISVAIIDGVSAGRKIFEIGIVHAARIAVFFGHLGDDANNDAPVSASTGADPSHDQPGIDPVWMSGNSRDAARIVFNGQHQAIVLLQGFADSNSSRLLDGVPRAHAGRQPPHQARARVGCGGKKEQYEGKFNQRVHVFP